MCQVKQITWKKPANTNANSEEAMKAQHDVKMKKKKIQ